MCLGSFGMYLDGLCDELKRSLCSQFACGQKACCSAWELQCGGLDWSYFGSVLLERECYKRSRRESLTGQIAEEYVWSPSGYEEPS